MYQVQFQGDIPAQSKETTEDSILPGMIRKNVIQDDNRKYQQKIEQAVDRRSKSRRQLWQKGGQGENSYNKTRQ